MSLTFSRAEGSMVLTAEQWLPLPPENVFPFYADAANLEQLTPPTLRFEIVSPVSRPMQAGLVIDYRLRVHGVPLRWRTLISEWEPNRMFVDEQLKGPYRLWRHTHLFEPRDGGTQVIDRVAYRVPGGALVERLLVRPDLRRIFRYRRAKLEEIFAGR